MGKPYDFRVDTWAMGIVLYTLAALESPFKGENLMMLSYNIVNKTPKLPPNVYSKRLTSLISRLLEKNPVKRPKIFELIDEFPSFVRKNSEKNLI
jgi:NIMA (never in mitosis gene a)-related kinase